MSRQVVTIAVEAVVGWWGGLAGGWWEWSKSEGSTVGTMDLNQTFFVFLFSFTCCLLFLFSFFCYFFCPANDRLRPLYSLVVFSVSLCAGLDWKRGAGGGGSGGLEVGKVCKHSIGR